MCDCAGVYVCGRGTNRETSPARSIWLRARDKDTKLPLLAVSILHNNPIEIQGLLQILHIFKLDICMALELVGLLVSRKLDRRDLMVTCSDMEAAIQCVSRDVHSTNAENISIASVKTLRPEKTISKSLWTVV